MIVSLSTFFRRIADFDIGWLFSSMSMNSQGEAMPLEADGVADFIEQLRRVLPTLLKDTPIDVAYLYGSVAKGCATRSGDVDIALLAAASLPLSDPHISTFCP